MTDLAAILREMGIVDDDEVAAGISSQPLTGGYHNDVSLVATRRGDVVVKHFVAGSTNPLYPQLPADEFRALQTLSGTRLAPEPLGFGDDVDGRAVLVYAFVPGEMWSAQRSSPAEVGAMLRRLHDQQVIARFREVPSTPHAVFAQSRAMVSGIDVPDRLFDHLAMGADAALPGSESPTLVHTDCGPGNIVVGSDGPCLIDWQCPGIGDPVEDLANFTSAAIQILYGLAPLTAEQVEGVLTGYADSRAVAAFGELRWPYHVRLAAYCVYRGEELRESQPEIAARYDLALHAELALLDTRS